MKILIPQEVLLNLVSNIKQDILTQFINFTSQRSHSFVEAELQWFFNQLPQTELTAQSSNFDELRQICTRAGNGAAIATIQSLDIQNVLILLALRSSFTHFLPYLTKENFVHLSGSIGPISDQTIAFAKVAVSQNSDLFANFSNFTVSAKN